MPSKNSFHPIERGGALGVLLAHQYTASMAFKSTTRRTCSAAIVGDSPGTVDPKPTFLEDSCRKLLKAREMTDTNWRRTRLLRQTKSTACAI